jgi:hypothetical protein
MGYFNRAEKAAINRPLLSWDRPLGDKGWRDWFDKVIDAGVDRFGGMRTRGQNPATQGLAIDSLIGEPYTGPVDPRFTTPTRLGSNRETHEQFMKRYGR